MLLPLVLDLIFDWLREWSQVIGALGSLLLSGLLVKLYWDQYKLSKAERSPTIESSTVDIDGDTLTLSISNYGDGLAKNMEIQTHVVYTGIKNWKEALYAGKRKAEYPINRFDDGEQSGERAIMGNEREVEFRGPPPFPTPDGEMYMDFNSGIHQLLTEHEARHFRYRIYLTYENEMGETSIEEITHTKEWSPNEDMIEELIERPSEISFETIYNTSVGIAHEISRERDFADRVTWWFER